MITETMTIHEALATLKILDKRINDKIYESHFVVAIKHNNTKINNLTTQEFVQTAEESYVSIMDMIRRRKAIRNALALSNASTIVRINDIDYTVSEAIEMKNNGMTLFENLCTSLANQIKQANGKIEKENTALDSLADNYVTGLFGAKEKVINNNDATTVRQAYIDANRYEVVSLKNPQLKVEALRKMIDSFEAEVDAKISVSNAVTTITIEY